MFAIIETGGKQYKVQKGDKLEIERLYFEPNTEYKFENVLLTSDGKSLKIGKPYLEGVHVSAKILSHKRAKKITIIKKKAKKRYEHRQGHRQELTVVEITDIKG